MNLLPLFLQIAQVGSSFQKMDLYHLWKQKLLVLEAVVVGDGHEKEVGEVRRPLDPVGGVVVAKTILHPAALRAIWSEFSSGISMKQL